MEVKRRLLHFVPDAFLTCAHTCHTFIIEDIQQQNRDQPSEEVVTTLTYYSGAILLHVIALTNKQQLEKRETKQKASS